MPSMMQILADLTPLNRVVCSDDYDKTIEYMKKVLPFEELSFSHDEAYNGWVIPPKWNVREAKILRNGKVIYDGTWHPMAVIALSSPFRGKVSREELRQHLHYDHRYDDSIPFHFRQLFRSWNRDWGFCVPKRFYDALEPGDYEVIIDTDESPGTLRMLEFTLPGRVEETIVFGTNLDHPGVSNDGLAGVVVGIELFRRLAKRSTNFNIPARAAAGNHRHRVLPGKASTGAPQTVAGRRDAGNAWLTYGACASAFSVWLFQHRVRPGAGIEDKWCPASRGRVRELAPQ
jgi:Uncharacterized protein conserved in bacteria with an aminopeptidase-like domain